MRSSRYFATAVVGGILAASVTVFTGPATANSTLTGTIQRSASNGASVTNVHFRTSCPSIGATQGFDAYVFEIPAGEDVMNTSVALTAPSTAPHDLGAYIYNSDCSADRNVTTAATFDLTLTLATGDKYLVVYSTSGANVAVTLNTTTSTSTDYYSSGNILRNAPTGISSTDTHFSIQCSFPPNSQGVDGWVFEVPTGYGSTATLTSNPSTQLHNFIGAVYKSDCSFDRLLDDTGSNDLAFTLGSTDAYVSVWSDSGANLWVDFKVTTP